MLLSRFQFGRWPLAVLPWVFAATSASAAASPANEPFFPLQWNMRAIQLPVESDIDGRGVVVAVLDSGRRDHPELDGQWLPGWDFVSQFDAGDVDGWDPDPTDVPQSAGRAIDRTPWHGLQVAGLIAARVDGRGLRGVAPGVRLLPVRVAAGERSHNADIVSALLWAVGGEVPGVPRNATPARVVNLSLGREGPCPAAVQAAVDFARSQGAVVVAAAGDEQVRATSHSPSNCQGVVAVGSASRQRRLTRNGNFGDGLTLIAPGGTSARAGYSDLLTTSNSGLRDGGPPAYENVVGSSFAAAHVTGVVALMLQLRPSATPAQIEAALRAGATPLPDCRACGAGFLNAGAALDRVRELADTGPIAAP